MSIGKFCSQASRIAVTSVPFVVTLAILKYPVPGHAVVLIFSV